MNPEQIEWNEARLAALRGVAEAAGAAIMGVYARLAGNNGNGGGETAMAIHRAGESESISFISTGGGAALELLEGKTLPGLAALPNRAA